MGVESLPVELGDDGILQVFADPQPGLIHGLPDLFHPGHGRGNLRAGQVSGGTYRHWRKPAALKGGARRQSAGQGGSLGAGWGQAQGNYSRGGGRSQQAAQGLSEDTDSGA